MRCEVRGEAILYSSALGSIHVGCGARCRLGVLADLARSLFHAKCILLFSLRFERNV